MKLCITSLGETLDSRVDPKFGRCKYFILVDSETGEFNVIDNSGINAGGGAGIKAGQLISENKAQAVLTGNVGPNAFQTLSAAKIEVITGVSGTVQDAIEKYKTGELKPDKEPSVGSHFGTGGN